MTDQDTTRNDRKYRKEQRRQDDDLTPLLPAVVLPVLIDAPPAIASTPETALDPAPSWDAGFAAATPAAVVVEATFEKPRPVTVTLDGEARPRPAEYWRRSLRPAYFSPLSSRTVTRWQPVHLRPTSSQTPSAQMLF